MLDCLKPDWFDDGVAVLEIGVLELFDSKCEWLPNELGGLDTGAFDVAFK